MCLAQTSKKPENSNNCLARYKPAAFDCNNACLVFAQTGNSVSYMAKTSAHTLDRDNAFAFHLQIKTQFYNNNNQSNNNNNFYCPTVEHVTCVKLMPN